MLKKLLKYDCKAAKILLPLFGVAALFTTLTVICASLKVFFDKNFLLAFIEGLFLFISVLSLIGVVVVTFAFVANRFYKNVLGDEGYIMLTLPINTSQLLFSKLIFALVVLMAAAVFVVGCFICIIISVTGESISNAGISNPTVIFIGGFLLVAVCIINAVLTLYTGMAISARFSQNRLLGSVAGYVLVTLAHQMITLAAFIIVDVLLVVTMGLGNAISAVEALINSSPETLVLMLFGIMIMFISITSLIMYRICRKELACNLNLA